MGVIDDVDVLAARLDLTNEEKWRLIATRKALELQSRVVAVLPITIGAVTITGVSRTEDMVVISGLGGRIDWPVQIVNPPLMVPDPAGTIVRTYIDHEGVKTTRTFRLDPIAVLRAVLLRLNQ